MRQRLRQLRSIARSTLIVERDHGHVRSLLRQESIDRSGTPLPWYTYPAIAWLENLDFSAADVFEFGSGNSTKFWADRARSVASVEDDAAWHARVSPTLPSTATCSLKTEREEYVAACSRPCDVIIVDGSHRLDCARASIRQIRPGGMMVLDNSDWFPNTARYLRDAGLTQVDFIGMGPINPYAWATSMFLRAGGPRLLHKGSFEVQSGIVQQGTTDY